MGRLLIGLGLLLVVVGLVVLGLERLGLGPGHIPGDLTYRGRNAGVFRFESV